MKKMHPFRRMNRRQRWRKTRVKMQDGKCYYCGAKMDSPTLDHVVPLSKGGIDEFQNTVAACYDCNKSKGDSMPDGMP